jgi:hypothetical protein
MLSQRAEGNLPDAQWIVLEQHIACCARCRQADDADRALREVRIMHTGMLETSAADAFDDRILAALRETETVTPITAPNALPAGHGIPARWQTAHPFSYLTQVAGGGLVAASVTMLVLLSSLHARSPVAPHLETPEIRAALSAARNEPPVPLESLLRSPAPRAALLWTAPGKEADKRPKSTRAPRNGY